ncbi:hypothetical protein CKQ84_11940 [Shewanella sp. WE21]|uniref:type II toxin-antitoxin system RelE/ParE family toxin n=1 Tax=Shewanella sp. WE21 TaxID=2029986 RepID=UPI000CF6F182|nr:type II toxin-antitoxin system RelE/ParE family toxin [Shewanella sp. WE21]AVI66538.1 hypothetical protein CKQ84_11940 [Shewanella sp. WE21]
MGRIFKTAEFTSWANDEGLEDAALLAAVDEMDRGLIDANLGGSVVKKRVPRLNQGKRSGFRTLIAFRSEDKAFYMFGFAKNERDNITKTEKAVLLELAKLLLSYSNTQLAKAIKDKELYEVIRNEPLT